MYLTIDENGNDAYQVTINEREYIVSKESVTLSGAKENMLVSYATLSFEPDKAVISGGIDISDDIENWNGRSFGSMSIVCGTFKEVMSNPVPDYTVDYENAVKPYSNGVRYRALLSKDTHITFPVKINFSGTYKVVGLVEAFSTAATGKISLTKGSTTKELGVNLDTSYAALDGSASSAWEQPLKTFGTIDLEKGDYTLRYSDV